MDKPTKHLITINSNDNKSNNLSNAIYDFGSLDLQESYAVRLKDISIVNLIYNINIGKNDRLDYNYNGVDFFIIIPEGSYNATTLVTAINALQTNLIFSINGVTQKFVVSSVLPSYLKSNSTIKKVLGFVNDTTLSTNYSLPFPFNLVRSNFINIVSNMAESSYCITSNKTTYPVIAQIPINLPFGYILQRSEEKDSADSYVFNSKVNLSNIKIKMLDDDFEELDLNQGNYILSFNIYKR